VRDLRNVTAADGQSRCGGLRNDRRRYRAGRRQQCGTLSFAHDHTDFADRLVLHRGKLLPPDREFAAFRAANISSALSHGFGVTGADSRTAVGVAAGGRTQVTGLVAAAPIAAVLMFLTEPLRFVPVAALGAVLIFAAFSLFDVGTLREIWKYDRL